MSLYVRTSTNGTDPAFVISDIGYVVAPGGWRALSVSDGVSPIGGDGYFTSIELKNSADLYVAITTGLVEWSIDGIAELIPADYNPDQVFVSEIVDSLFDFASTGRVIFRNVVDSGDITDPLPGEVVFTQDGYFLGYDGVAFNPIGTANPDDFVFGELNLTGGEQISSVNGELVFTDSSGVASLTTLKSMKNIWADGYGYNQITIEDGYEWNAQYSFISSVLVDTTSTDWDLFIYEDDSFINGTQIVSSGLENMTVEVGLEYNSADTKIRFIYLSNDGDTSNANIRVNGEARRH